MYPFNGLHEQASEIVGVDVGGRQDGFVQVLAGARIIVVIGGDAYLRPGRLESNEC